MTAGQEQVVAFILSAMGIIFIPLMVVLYRGIVKWTRTESKLDELIIDMKALVTDKDTVHRELYKQMTDDRKATDSRLRWLEEHIWKRDARSLSIV